MATKCFSISSPLCHELAIMHHELVTMLEYEAQNLLPPYVHTYIPNKSQILLACKSNHRDPIWNMVTDRFARNNYCCKKPLYRYSGWSTTKVLSRRMNGGNQVLQAYLF